MYIKLRVMYLSDCNDRYVNFETFVWFFNQEKSFWPTRVVSAGLDIPKTLTNPSVTLALEITLKHGCLWRQTSKPKHVLEIRASGIWSHWKNNSLLIYVTHISTCTNSQCSCFSLPFFALYAHASKQKGLYDEYGDRCSFNDTRWWSWKSDLRRQRWWMARSGEWICQLSPWVDEVLEV